jgi:hypothetical protein
MSPFIILSGLAILAQEAEPASAAHRAWSVSVKGEMSGSKPGLIYDELASVWNMDGHLIWGQVIVTALEVKINIAARGCLLGAEDYRQEVTIPRAASVDLEAATLERQAKTVFTVVQEQCSLEKETMSQFLDGLGIAYRDLSARARNQSPGVR